MIGKLYIIRNTVNDKVYVGKTYKPLEQRFKEHKKESKRERNKTRHLYKAINSIGFDKFYIEALGEHEEGLLEKLEVNTIQKFNSYVNGYNMTLGGDGKTYFPYSGEEVINKYKELKSIRATAKYFDCDIWTIKIRLVNNNVKVLSSTEVVRSPIYIPEIKRSFTSVTEACRFLQKYYTSAMVNSIKGRITAVLAKNKYRHSYLGMTFLKI